MDQWEAGLPDINDLPPLSQLLISPELASAFNITPDPHRNMTDVTRASHKTLSTLVQHPKQQIILDKVNDNIIISSSDEKEEMVVEGDETVELIDQEGSGSGSGSRKLRRFGSGGGDSSATSAKRVRLVWTPQLHKRFVEVVKNLGLKKAVPKTVLQLMNVEGLTRENVASHLQKYRLYVKRRPGLLNVCKGLNDSGGVSGTQNWEGSVPVGMAYPPQMVGMPYAPVRMVPNLGGGGGSGGGAYHHGFEYCLHPYNMMMQPKDWFGNGFGSVSAYQHPMTHKS